MTTISRTPSRTDNTVSSLNGQRKQANPPELTTVHTLKYDLAPIPLLEFSRGVVVQRVQFYTATLKLKLILSEQGLRSELYFVSQQPKPDLLLDSKPDSA